LARKKGRGDRDPARLTLEKRLGLFVVDKDEPDVLPVAAEAPMIPLMPSPGSPKTVLTARSIRTLDEEL
jgi:hypothetical protein